MAEKRETPFTDWVLTVPLETAAHTPVRSVGEAVEALQTVFTAFVGQPEKGGETEYRHLQIFAQMASRTRFSTLKRKLVDAGLGDVHMENRKGTVAQALDYVTKEDTKDGEVIHFGDMDYGDDCNQGHRSDLDRLRERAENGESVESILRSEDGTKAARCIDWLTRTVQAFQSQKAKSGTREVHVNFMYGATGAGKTRYVYDTYGYEDVYSVDDYEHPFDTYEGEKVMLFDEFAGQISIEYMLRLLDRYPVKLKARYANKQAAYETVWLVSNIAPEELYAYAPLTQRQAFWRRVGHVYHMAAGKLEEDQKPDLFATVRSRLMK